jgi:capsular polysaccharide biosynthesis protein
MQQHYGVMVWLNARGYVSRQPGMVVRSVYPVRRGHSIRKMKLLAGLMLTVKSSR